MKRFSWALVAGVVGAGVFISAGAARAADADREGRWDVFGIARYADGDDTTAGSPFFVEKVALDPSFALGIGVGYNLTDHLNINATVLFGQAEWSYSQGGFPTGDETNPLIDTIGNLEWNILDARSTPFLTAGAGVIMFPDNDLAGRGQFSYGAGAGWRWDFGDDAFLKVWYRSEWFSLAGANDGLQSHTFNVGIGIMR